MTRPSVPMNGIRSDVVRIRPTFCIMLACTAREDTILPYYIGAKQPFDTKKHCLCHTQRQCSFLFGFQLDDLFHAQQFQILVPVGDQNGGAAPAVIQDGFRGQQPVFFVQAGEGLDQGHKSAAG